MDVLECYGCKVAYTDQDQCPVCWRYLVITDPRPPYIPQLTVAGVGISQLWDLTVNASVGLEPASALVPPVKKLENQFQQDLADPTLDGELHQWVEVILPALTQIKRFAETRRVADLNQGWVNLIGAVDGYRNRWEELGVDMGGKYDHSAWWQSASAFMQPADKIDAFTDPNE